MLAGCPSRSGLGARLDRLCIHDCSQRHGERQQEQSAEKGKRPTAKIFADGTKQLFSYDLSGRLAAETDAKGQVKRYSYNVDDTLKQLSYNVDDTLKQLSYDHAQNPTASVSFTYDTTYQRVLTMLDASTTQ